MQRFIPAFVKTWIAGVCSGNARLPGLFWLSAGETTVLPIPMELVLFPVMQLNRQRLWPIATAAVAGSLAAAIAAYALVHFVMEGIRTPLLAALGWDHTFESFSHFFAANGFWAVFAAGMLPAVPLQIGIIAAGAAGYNIVGFALAIFASRALRYYTIAWLVQHHGDGAAALFKRNKAAFALWAVGLVVVLWLAGRAASAWFMPGF